MTVEEAIIELQLLVRSTTSSKPLHALNIAISALEKEKEPAPQEAETSSNNNNSISNDNTKLKICQEIIERNIEQLVIHHAQLSDAEKRQYVDLCFVEQVLKEATK